MRRVGVRNANRYAPLQLGFLVSKRQLASSNSVKGGALAKNEFDACLALENTSDRTIAQRASYEHFFLPFPFK